MQRILVIVSGAAFLVASGVVHGVWTDRWSDQADLTAAAQRLDLLPLSIGAWHGQDVTMEKDPNSGLAGMLARRYVHEKSGKIVTLFLACGRARAVCTHTPDVCYAGNGFEVEKPKRFQQPSSTAQAPPEFWTARFVKERADGRTNLRIFWSWYAGDTWKVGTDPRLTFAGEKLLYKLYLIRESAQPEESMEGDACVEFMQDMLPAFRQSVILGL